VVHRVGFVSGKFYKSIFIRDLFEFFFEIPYKELFVVYNFYNIEKEGQISMLTVGVV